MSAEPNQIITAAEVKQAEGERRSLITKMADKYGLEPNRMMATLKATAFKGDVTNEQMAALLIVADQHNLNPWLKEIYAFPSRQGIVPIVGLDGWARIVNSHPQFDGMDFEQDDEKCTCRIYRKDRSHPVAVTEYMIECKRSTDPWNTHPKRMLRHKAMIQAARLAFSFSGIYDPDEGERVLAAENAIDVTPRDEDGHPIDPEKLSPKKLREVVEAMLAAVSANDGPALWAVWNSITSGQQLFAWGTLRSWERSAVKKLQDATKWAKGGLDLPSWSVEAIRGAPDPVALESVWTTIQEAFAENDSEVPADIETTYIDRKTELGA